LGLSPIPFTTRLNGNAHTTRDPPARFTETMDLLPHIWHYLVIIVTVVLAILASGHAILYKRDSRATLLWVGFIWFSPLVGAVLYFLLGVNRIRRRALLLRGDLERYSAEANRPTDQQLASHNKFQREFPQLSHFERLVKGIVQRPLLPGNRVDPLINGDEAFPAMLDAIRHARTSVTLATYIFDRGSIGLDFVDALGDAVRRGLDVRVLIDATGARYSFPTILRSLRRAGVPFARFLPTLVPIRVLSINLRNHRKILVADGHVGFTGGMNIRAGHRLAGHPSHPVRDIQFRVQGPVVAQLQEVFADDWRFCTGEALRGDAWFPPLEPAGDVFARCIADGPDEDFEKLRWTLLGALSCASHSVRIVTPYFLPDPALISALNVAAMRGVQVDILLPEKNNLPFVHWAMCAGLWQVIQGGCRVWLTPPPFDHSKLMVMDSQWSLIGSANWDPRSLRLNFELNLECYNRSLAARLDRLIEDRMKSARPLSLRDLDERPLPIKLRDGIARLATPFL
jgi:cardiolipin synthase